MPKIDYQELLSLSREVTYLRQKTVSYLKEYTASNQQFLEDDRLLGNAWQSAKNYQHNYQLVSDAIFNALYDLDDSLKLYISNFQSMIGEAQNQLDTDRLEALKSELRQLQLEKMDFMEAMAKVFKDVPVLKEFFGQQSMYGKTNEIEILERYKQFEERNSGNFEHVSTTIHSIQQGLAYLGRSNSFENGTNGYHTLNLNDLSWYNQLKEYNENSQGDRVEIMEMDSP